MANIQPNRYALQSKDGKVKVDYVTSSLIGQPTLTLTLAPDPVRYFTGSQIRTINTEIGNLISVTTMMTVDTGSKSFTLLLPAISLANSTGSQQFSTEAIFTSHSGPNSVPSTGVLEKYQFIALDGTASFVLTLFEPVAGQLAQAAKQ